MAGNPAWVKGKSGNPIGRRAEDKPWSEALRRAAFQDGPEGHRRLFKIAEACVAAAEGGDMTAIKEIGDRLDGKPVQENINTEKRDATDWTLTELVAFVRERRADGGRISAESGSANEPDTVHGVHVRQISNGKTSSFDS
jgi:hypothetical protein